MHAQSQRLSDVGRLIGEEALQRARPIKTDEVVVKHVRERDLGAFGERMAARHCQYEPILPKRISLERAHVDSGGDDTEVGDPLGN